MEGLAWLRQHLDVPGVDFLFLNAPDSWPTPLGDGYSWYPAIPAHAEGIRRSRGLIYRVLEEIQSCGVSSSSVAFLGFSQGCVMSMEVGLSLESRLAGIVGISGFIHQPARLVEGLKPHHSKLSIFLSHGWQDEVLSFEKTEEQMEILKPHLAGLQWHPMSKGHHVGAGELDLVEAFLARIFPKEGGLG